MTKSPSGRRTTSAECRVEQFARCPVLSCGLDSFVETFHVSDQVPTRPQSGNHYTSASAGAMRVTGP